MLVLVVHIAKLHSYIASVYTAANANTNYRQLSLLESRDLCMCVYFVLSIFVLLCACELFIIDRQVL